jgi:hypothetical protein
LLRDLNFGQFVYREIALLRVATYILSKLRLAETLGATAYPPHSLEACLLFGKYKLQSDNNELHGYNALVSKRDGLADRLHGVFEEDEMECNHCWTPRRIR